MTYTGIKEKMESMHPFYIWLVFLILYVSFSIDVLWRPFVFAEDTIFLNNALTDGFKSIIYRHAEYLEIISRLSANTAILFGKLANSYLVTAFVMKTFAIGIMGYYISYFALADFSWLVNKKLYRFVICFFFLAWFGNFVNSYYNITNIHWAGEFFVFLVGLNLLFNNKFPGVFCLIICVLTCLQSPEATLLIIPFALYILNRIRDKKIRWSEMLAYLVVFTAVFLQFFVVKKSGTGSGAFNPAVIMVAVPKSLIAVLSAASYVLGNEIRSFLSPGLKLTAGCLVWLFIVFSYIKLFRKKGIWIVTYSLIFLFFHYMMVYVKLCAKGLGDFIIPEDNWVNSSPAAVCVLLLFGAVLNINSIFMRGLCKQILVLLLMPILISEVSHTGKIGGLFKYDYDVLGMKLIEDANQSVDFNSSKYETLHLYSGFQLLIPVR